MNEAYTGLIETYALSMTSHNQWKESKRMIILKGSFGTANLYFEAVRGTASQNKKHNDTRQIDVFLALDDWLPVVDMLRNEQSTAFMFNEETGSAVVFTGDEPAGEGP